MAKNRINTPMSARLGTGVFRQTQPQGTPGRDGDKFAHTRLKPVAAQKVRVPIIEQGLVHYECRVVHTNEVIPANLAADIQSSAYANGDYHRVYFGEVLAAYAAADAREKLKRALL